MGSGPFRPAAHSDRPVQTAFYRSERAILKSISAEALSAQNRKRPVQTAFYRSERAILKSIFFHPGPFRPLFTGLNGPF